MSAAPRRRGPRDVAALRIVAGSPADEEIAALVVALAVTPPPIRTPRPPRPAPPAAKPPAWARAARREAVGGPPVASPADLLPRP
ncbi:MAG TPA: hypothetical protein VM324_09450 [Egibacteraceae bacterium]|nr:hypothetical protein [Egibacteraceae bacterium]